MNAALQRLVDYTSCEYGNGPPCPGDPPYETVCPHCQGAAALASSPPRTVAHGEQAVIEILRQSVMAFLEPAGDTPAQVRQQGIEALNQWRAWANTEAGYPCPMPFPRDEPSRCTCDETTSERMIYCPVHQRWPLTTPPAHAEEL